MWPLFFPPFFSICSCFRGSGDLLYLLGRQKEKRWRPIFIGWYWKGHPVGLVTVISHTFVYLLTTPRLIFRDLTPPLSRVTSCSPYTVKNILRPTLTLRILRWTINSTCLWSVGLRHVQSPMGIPSMWGWSGNLSVVHFSSLIGGIFLKLSLPRRLLQLWGPSWSCRGPFIYEGRLILCQQPCLIVDNC